MGRKQNHHGGKGVVGNILTKLRIFVPTNVVHVHGKGGKGVGPIEAGVVVLHYLNTVKESPVVPHPLCGVVDIIPGSC